MNFVDFNRAGDWIGSLVAAGEKHGRRTSDKRYPRCNLRLEMQGGASLSIRRANLQRLLRARVTPMPGYSGTPLVRKLGISAHEQVVALGAPEHYPKLLEGLPDGVSISSRVVAGARFVHLFVTKRADLQKRLETLREKLDDAGVLWVSWPKKSSGVATDVTEDTIRAVALPMGYVDVKVCAVDEIWSGLKLMIRRVNRGKGGV